MDKQTIEELVKKHFDRWVTDTEFGNVEVHIRAALTEQAAGYEQKLAFAEDAAAKGDLARSAADGMAMEIAELKERIRQLEAEQMQPPSCTTCANRGRVNGLSQEMYCDWCLWQGQGYRVSHYAPLPPKKEGECVHRFMYFGDQPNRRCADCNAIEGAAS